MVADDSRRANAFGLLRLVFAFAVMVSHSAEIIDGNRSREVLQGWAAGRSLGDIAVFCFFILSGLLISKSFLNSANWRLYLLKRLLRIYPGFIACCIACLILAQATNGWQPLSLRQIAEQGILIATLQGPSLPAFTTLPYQSVNGSLWTISAEFRCYILVILLGTIGVLNRKTVLIVVTSGLLLLNQIETHLHFSGGVMRVTGEPNIAIRLIAFFMVGATLAQINLKYFRSGFAAFGAAAAILISGYFSVFFDIIFALSGSYLIVYLGFLLADTPFGQINSKNDISYGVYLYAWPIQSLIVFTFGVRSPLLLLVCSIPLVVVVGWLSWMWVEMPFVRRRRHTGFAGTQGGSA